MILTLLLLCLCYWWVLKREDSLLLGATVDPNARLPPTFRVLVWNMQLLPWPASSRSWSRAKAMLESRLFDQADMVVLLEVVRHAPRVAARLRQRGFAWCTRPLTHARRLNGGVVMASRFAPSETHHEVFADVTHCDGNRLIAKGFVRAQWGGVGIVGTHLNSCDSATRCSQVEEIRRTMAATELWAGDFNFELRRGDCRVPAVRGQTTWRDQLLDGVVCVRGRAKLEQRRHLLPGSDHWPVLATVDL